MNAFTLLAALAASAASACPGLEVRDAWVRQPTPGAAMLAAYATLRNTGAKALQIDGFGGADFGTVTLHRTTIANGMSRMRHAGPVELAPGQSVALAPGGLHLMLMDPRRTLHAGDRTELSLQCGTARREFPFTVKPE
jgi:copper(I)-binding protein